VLPRPLPARVHSDLMGSPPTTKAPRTQGFRRCAEEDSNLHPVIPDQALNLVARVSYPSEVSRTSCLSADLDGMDAMDDLDVATAVAALGDAPREFRAAPASPGVTEAKARGGADQRVLRRLD
jgi:hypothetical protein